MRNHDCIPGLFRVYVEVGKVDGLLRLQLLTECRT